MKIPGSIVGIAICSLAFAGEILPEKCYNAPAKIDLCAFFDLSFIYLYACQDGMGLCSSADLKASGATESQIVFNQSSRSLVQDFAYKPGFKVGFGAGVGQWEFHAEYTWIRQKTHVDEDAPKNRTNGGGNIPVWVVNSWFGQTVGAFGDFVSCTNIQSSWRLGIDWLDLTGGRPYYQSKRVTINPYGGLRAVWIRQSLLIAATVPDAAVFGGGDLAPQPIHSHNRSNCWGIGPVFGGNARCLLGAGFRVEGIGGVSILFTRYTTLIHEEDAAVTGMTPTVFRGVASNYNTVRPFANLGIGLGWGEYIYNGKYHIDFAADYDFNVLWNQNMIRTFAEEFANGIAPSNDLYLQGLTITGRFDF